MHDMPFAGGHGGACHRVEDSCFICHFKDGERESGTSDCLLCHNTGENGSTARTGDFDHVPLREKGVPCTSCHQGVTRGSGQLKPESCRECHDQPMQDVLDEPVELLHRVHVTDHKVECSLCHDPIEHSLQEDPSAGMPHCGSCHEDKHKGISDMYRGTGARGGIMPLPSPMQKAHVGCSGCHIVPDPAGGMGAAFTGMNMIAVRAACQSCHPDSYALKVDEWKNDIAAALKNAKQLLRETERGLGAKAGDDAWVLRTLDNTRRNLLFVESSTALHNRDYAMRILDKAVLDLKDVAEKSRQR